MRPLNALCAVLVCCLVNTGSSRTWTDVTGNFKVEAEFVRYANGDVVLRKADGRTISVPASKLSEQDRSFVKRKLEGVDDDTDLAKLEKQANKQRSAADAVRVYRLFLAGKKIAEQQRTAAQERLTYWEDRAKDQYVRVGRNWMSVEEAKTLEDLEENLIIEASRLMDVDNNDLAVRKLKEASRVCPHRIRADFLLGVIHALGMRDAPEAEKYFNKCVTRRAGVVDLLDRTERANHVAALNNLAIAKARRRDYRGAVRSWQRALELGAPSAAIVQNLGRFAHLSKTTRYFNPPSATAASLAQLYAQVAVKTGFGPFSENTGWLYMQFVDEPTIQSRVDSVQDAPSVETVNPTDGQPSGSQVLTGGGTAFVIHGDYILTNRHVVKGASAVAVVKNDGQPANNNSQATKLPAKIIAISKDDDLALLKCDGLNAPAVHFQPGTPRLAIEIITLGFPEFDILGQDLKVTRGTISGLPNPRTDNMLLFDAVINPGNSGGPVCNQAGRVVAVATAYLNLDAGKLGAGVPADRAISFVRQHLADYKPSSTSTAASKSWADVVEAVGPSTVNVLVYQDTATAKLGSQLSSQQSEQGQTWLAFEDPWCMVCSGKGALECPVKRCTGGGVPSSRIVNKGVNPITGQPLTERVRTTVRCSTCAGNGKVRCRYCTRGLDPQVLRSR